MFSDVPLKLTSSSIQDFIFHHENDDERKLVLSYKEILGVPSSLVASQLAARRKAKYKLPLWWKTKGIIYPPSINLEQSSSEATARYKASLLEKNKSGIDLTGGFGVDSFFLSQCFERFHYAEPHEELLELARYNHQLLGVKNIEYIHSSAEEVIRNCTEQFDFAFIDPSRRNKQQKVFKLADCEPNIVELLPALRRKAKEILIKASPLLDIQQSKLELNKVKQIWVVAVDNECKELLFQIDQEANQPTLINAVDLDATGNLLNIISFEQEDERNAIVSFSPPQKWLFEPNASILKSGAFKIVAQKYQLNKLHPNTHLYTSNFLFHDFPGRVFEIIDHMKPDKKLKDLFPNSQANILTRNYPLSVEEIKKKTGLKEGGELFLIGTQSEKEKHLLIARRMLR
jgi:16S rRNA G966 N2-methylase RsmD